MDNQPDYEALCITLYAYRFGTITFVELLEHLEAALDLHEAKPFDAHHASDEDERA